MTFLKQYFKTLFRFFLIMPNIPRDGIVFPYVDTECGLATLVFVSPFGASMNVWRAQRTHFEDLNYRVILYDPRGHGRNHGTASEGKKGEYSIGLFAQDLEALLDHCAVQRATLVGASLGGMVALEYAGMHPERVDNLVLVGSYAKALLKKGKQYTAENRKTRDSFLRDHRVIRRKSIAALKEEKVVSYFGKPYDELSKDEQRACDAYFRSVAEMRREEYIATDLAILYKHDQMETLKRFGKSHEIGGKGKHPVYANHVLFITGERDFFKDAQEEMHASVRGSRVVEIPDAGHLCWLNNPAAFNAAVDKSFSDVSDAWSNL
jgi:pimeloyl-ACP methyl ester carboxylesterase